MRLRPFLTALLLATVAATAGEAEAQLFRADRALGSSVSRKARASTPTDVGTLSGNERYIRGNRQGTNFVGTDAAESRNFVGAQTGPSAGAGTGSRSSAASGLRIETAPDANRASGASSLRTSRSGIYRPRLAIAFDHPPLASQGLKTTRSEHLGRSLTGQLESRFRAPGSRSIEVSLEGGKATLRGEVPSERERTLAGLLLLFEPGIAEVQNELAVRPPGSPPAAPALPPPTAPTSEASRPSAAHSDPAASSPP